MDAGLLEAYFDEKEIAEEKKRRRTRQRLLGIVGVIVALSACAVLFFLL